MQFQKAERKQVKLKLGLTGPSGSGKTFSALRLAKGLMDARGGEYRIALIDTENRSASLYADTQGMPQFDTLELEPPYTVEKYIQAIEAAIKAKYDVLVVDSISHVWSGEGGLLQEKENLDSRGGNSFANWAKMTPKWNRFVSSILHSDIHMLCTMRSKQEHALSQNDKGKSEVKKMGMAPQVREGFEYELTAVFDMDMSHQAQASKDRTNLFDGRTWKPDEKTGAEIYKWLNSGKPPEPKTVIPLKGEGPVSNEELKKLFNMAERRKWTTDHVRRFMDFAYKKASTSALTKDEYLDLCTIIEQYTAEEALHSQNNAPKQGDDVP